MAADPMDELELVFDDRLKEVPVKIGDKRYKLRQPDGDAVTRWRAVQLKATRPGKDGSPSSLEGMAESEVILVSRCLYHIDEQGRIRVDNEGYPDPRYLVSDRTIRRWPAQVQRDLFQRCLSMANLLTEETKESLTKQIAELQAKLDDLNDDEHQAQLEEDRAKNVPCSTDGSACPPN